MQMKIKCELDIDKLNEILDNATACDSIYERFSCPLLDSRDCDSNGCLESLRKYIGIVVIK
jgi:hypothetical protein